MNPMDVVTNYESVLECVDYQRPVGRKSDLFIRFVWRKDSKRGKRAENSTSVQGASLRWCGIAKPKAMMFYKNPLAGPELAKKNYQRFY